MADSTLKPRPAAAASSSPGAAPVPAVAVTGPGYTQNTRVRMRLLELRRMARALVARLVPYLAQVVLLLLALCLVALFVPLPPLGTRQEEHGALESGGGLSMGANGNAPPAVAEAVTMQRIEGVHPNGTMEEEEQHNPGLKERGSAAAASGEADLGSGAKVKIQRHTDNEGDEDEDGKREGIGQREGDMEGHTVPAVAERASNAADPVEGLEQNAGTGAAVYGEPGAEGGSVQGQVGSAKEGWRADRGSAAAAMSGGNATELCGNAAVEQGTIRWDPAAASARAKRAAPRFLLLNCFRGQASKLLLCVRNHILLAALLNRTLIVPSSLPDTRHPTRTLDTRVFFDIKQAKKCAGPSAVISTAEYLTQYRATHVPLDLLYCWHGPRGACGEATREKVHGRASALEATWACPAAVDLEKAREQLLAGGSHVVPLQIHPPFFTDPLAPAHADTPTKAACLHVAATLHDVMAAFHGAEAGVMAVGDLGDFEVYERGLGHLHMQPSGDPPIVRSPACPNALVMSPHAALIRWASEIRASLVPRGREFLAVHWAGRPVHRAECGRSPLRGRCLYRLEQAAMCAVKEAESLGIWTVYVAKGGGKIKMNAFKEALGKYSDGRLTVTSLPRKLSGPKAPASPWLKELAGLDLEAQWPLISSTLDKLVAAQGTAFLGNPAAPFSIDIQRLRYGLKQASCNDGLLCDGAAEWDADRQP